MYHYIQSEPGLWTVGTGTPKSMGGNDWIPESDHSSPQEAAERVRVLNGGTPIREKDELAALRERIAELESEDMLMAFQRLCNQYPNESAVSLWHMAQKEAIK